LSAGINGDQVVAGLDEISGPTTTESASSSSTSSALTTATPAGGTTDRAFGRAQIHLTRRSTPAPALPSPTARKAAARLHPLAERAQRSSVTPRAHRVHGIASGVEGRRVTADRSSPSTGSRISAAIRT
jgi:hypothetical protein